VNYYRNHIAPSSTAFELKMSQSSDNEAASPRKMVETAMRSRGPMEPEQSLWSGGYSAKAMIGTWLISSIVTAAILAALFMLPIADYIKLEPRMVWTVALGIILVWWLGGIVMYFYRRISTHYELTNQRFIHKQGILLRTTDRIDIIDIDDVTFSQGIVERILGIGTIILSSSDATHPKLCLRGIDGVDKVSGMIDDTRRKERRKRSLHIETV
jgi:uncharacterized membrane protein YdbT with pleckstrin-like domain